MLDVEGEESAPAPSSFIPAHYRRTHELKKGHYNNVFLPERREAERAEAARLHQLWLTAESKKKEAAKTKSSHLSAAASLPLHSRPAPSNLPPQKETKRKASSGADVYGGMEAKRVPPAHFYPGMAMYAAAYPQAYPTHYAQHAQPPQFDELGPAVPETALHRWMPNPAAPLPHLEPNLERYLCDLGETPATSAAYAYPPASSAPPQPQTPQAPQPQIPAYHHPMQTAYHSEMREPFSFPHGYANGPNGELVQGQGYPFFPSGYPVRAPPMQGQPFPPFSAQPAAAQY